METQRLEKLERSLKVALTRAGLTQADVAARLGVAPTTFNAWLRGRHPAPDGIDELVRRIEGALDLTRGTLEVQP
jgi:transcriptional regulator with XRE-family HTH domain